MGKQLYLCRCDYDCESNGLQIRHPPCTIACLLPDHGAELHLGLVACLSCVQDIGVGEELTFDYNFERYGDKPLHCHCGSRMCRKFIGGTQVNLHLYVNVLTNSQSQGHG